MRKGASIFGIFVILLVSLFPIISSEPFYFDNSDVQTDLEHLPLNSISDASNEVNLTWTSRTQQVPQLIENESIAVGDHVVLNATFPQTQNVTECKLKIWNTQVNVNTTVSCLGSRISFDTYYLDRSNQTYGIMVNGTTSTNDSIIMIWENVTICNFFAPELSLYVIQHTSDDIVFNFTWNCEDQNLDDVNYYSLWLSRDGGTTYVLLRQNLTQTWFCWNASIWFEADYFVMVRAYSVDYSSSECGLDDPPVSYWPGDYSETFSPYPFHAEGSHSYPPFYYSLEISYLDDIIYEFGSLGNNASLTLTIIHHTPSSLQYYLLDNGTTWFNGEIFPTSTHEILIFSIDGLDVGIHNIEVYVESYSGYISTEFIITVIDDGHTTSDFGSSLIQALAVGVSIGSVTIIAYVIIMSIRLRRNRVVEYV